MKRELIREKTMQLVYQMDVSGDFDYKHHQLVEETEDVLKEAQARELLDSLAAHIEEIDAKLSENIRGWTIERLPRIDLAILRVALCEILYIDSVPNGVAINEAVNLAKKYGEDKSYAFINSVLGKINRELHHE